MASLSAYRDADFATMVTTRLLLKLVSPPSDDTSYFRPEQ